YKFGVGFDENRNAIQIPYLDTYGNIVGFAFRNMDEDKPKYINSKEDNVSKKSDLLFGLDKARHHISDRIYIVEGYLHVMATWQMVYNETAPYCHSATTPNRGHLVSKRVDRHTQLYLIPGNEKTGLKQVAETVT